METQTVWFPSTVTTEHWAYLLFYWSLFFGRRILKSTLQCPKAAPFKDCSSCYLSLSFCNSIRWYLTITDTKQVGRKKESDTDSTESVVFLHGFLSSSSLWVETVFHNLSEVTKQSFRMVAVDLLGFGRSPKPTNCTYTVREHLDMIEASVVRPLELNSYHIVAHSMGCIIALAMAAKHPESVKSLTLVAPVSPHITELNRVFFWVLVMFAVICFDTQPCFDSTEEEASHTALNKLAERRVWPPFLFGCAVMSWYEHIGRTVCFIFCRNHSTWEWMMKLVTGRR